MTLDTKPTPTDEQSSVIEAVAGPDSVMVDALAGCAKALRNDQPVLTPKGWMAIADLVIGDLVIGRDGKAYPVTAVLPQGVRDCYELIFSDGAKIVATEDHIWPMERADKRSKGEYMNVTTSHLYAKPRSGAGIMAEWGDGTRAYWFSLLCKPVEFAPRKRELYIDPWLLGLLLGDGTLAERSVGFTTADSEITEWVQDIVRKDYDLGVYVKDKKGLGFQITNGEAGKQNNLMRELRILLLAGVKSPDKFIPRDYLLGSKETRLAVLQGLMDSDGYANRSRAVFTSSSCILARDVKFLVESLGGTVTENVFETSHLPAYRLSIKLSKGETPFRLKRKKDGYWSGQRPPYRALEKVNKVAPAEATCIRVNSPDNLFLTRNFIPTHNSTTLQMAAPRVKVPALALAFNKKIAEDLKPRLPGNFTTKTFNGLGFQAALRALPAVGKAELDDKKLGKLVSQVARDRKVDLSAENWDQLRQLVRGAMQAGITPGDRGRPLTPDTEESWRGVAEDLWIPPTELEFLGDLAKEVLGRNIELVERGVFSFDDQVYFSTCIAGQYPKFPVVFVDEKQDLSPLNIAALALSVREDGKVVAVGDDRQSIYQFRGADAAASKKIELLRGNWKKLGLMTTFRCPKAVVARQQGHAPGYKAWHTNAEGEVHTLAGSDSGGGDSGGGADFSEQGWSWSDVRKLAPSPQSSVMVLCRNNGPLLSLAFKLLRAQIGVVMLGRDIGKNLVSLSRKLLPEDTTDKFLASGIVSAWIEDECGLARANGHEERCAGITDRGECLLAVLSSGCRDAGELRAMLSRLFARDSGQVELSSIHKAKGLERDVILHLDPFRIPSRWAREAAKAGDYRQLEQENNLRYVAETRTKHTLILANLEDFHG